MFVAAYQRTMAGAKPKLQPAEIEAEETYTVTVEDRLRERRAQNMERIRREIMAVRQERERKIRALAHAHAEAHRRYRESLSRTPAADIVRQVATWHGVSVEAIFSPSRVLATCTARLDAMVAVYCNCMIAGRPLTLTDMGRLFHRDHTTILWALKKAGVRA